MSESQKMVRKIVENLDQILDLIDKDFQTGLRPTISNEMQTIVTIPDLFNMDRLQESIIYLKDFYNLD